MKSNRVVWMVLAVGGLLVSAARADELEMRDGRKLVGKVLSETDNTISFQIVYPNGGTADMAVSKNDVQSVKLGPLPEKPKPPPKVEPPKPVPPKVEPPKTDPPKVEPPKPGEEEDPDADSLTAAAKPDPTHIPTATSQPDKPGSRTRAEIDAMIDKAGREAPPWWNSVQMNYPKTMDLSWPERPPTPGWDPNKNINQYLISVLNRDPSRHKEGCVFLQYVFSQNKGNNSVQFRASQMLGQYFGELVQDYARGAFWYRKAQKLGTLGPMHASNLANCYAKLGSKELAIAELDKAGNFPQCIRLLGELGELNRAVPLAKGVNPPEYGNLLVGDIYRFNGSWKDAFDFYSKSASSGGKNRKAVDMGRASADAIKSFEAFDLKKIADGAYHGESGGGFRGVVKVDATVKEGKITGLRVVETKEDWPLNAHVAIPAQIIEKQSVKGIDTVTGATYTSDAVLNAAAKALGSGVK